jgi:choline dehydrogenase-like flavoprotein
MQVLRAPGPLESALTGVARREIPWGAGFHDGFSKRFLHTANLAIVTEDLPDPENRVTLDHALKDSNGIPSPKISYRLGDNTKKMLSHGLSRGRELMIAAGAKKTVAFGPVRNTGWHLMGTARMGIDPKVSVVNSSGQSHDVPNLFIIDSSIFVTAGGVNPTSTIQALALRISDCIKNEAKHLLNR